VTTRGEQVCEAFAALMAAYVAPVVVERNKPAPTKLEPGESRVIVVDGPEPEETYEKVTGIKLCRRTVSVEGHLVVPKPIDGAMTDPGMLANELRGRVLQAARQDETLGGLLYGHTTSGVVRRRYTGLEEGPFDVEIWREPGTTPGAAFAQEFVLQYATARTNPSVPAGGLC
jgi:hypothetical protein